MVVEQPPQTSRTAMPAWPQRRTSMPPKTRRAQWFRRRLSCLFRPAERRWPKPRSSTGCPQPKAGGRQRLSHGRSQDLAHLLGAGLRRHGDAYQPVVEELGVAQVGRVAFAPPPATTICRGTTDMHHDNA